MKNILILPRFKMAFLSMLLIIFMESTYIIRKALDNQKGVFAIGGKKINNLQYADDTTLLAKDELEMTKLVENIENERINDRLKLNRQKTKLMIPYRSKRHNKKCNQHTRYRNCQ